MRFILAGGTKLCARREFPGRRSTVVLQNESIRLSISIRRGRRRPNPRAGTPIQGAIIYASSSARVVPRAGASKVGEWLSLVEHLVRDQGVGGSNPLSPTNYLFNTSRIAENLRTAKRTHIRVAETSCARNSRHTVAAAMLTASTLSSHHVRCKHFGNSKSGIHLYPPH